MSKVEVLNVRNSILVFMFSGHIHGGVVDGRQIEIYFFYPVFFPLYFPDSEQLHKSTFSTLFKNTSAIEGKGGNQASGGVFSISRLWEHQYLWSIWNERDTGDFKIFRLIWRMNGPGIKRKNFGIATPNHYLWHEYISFQDKRMAYGVWYCGQKNCNEWNEWVEHFSGSLQFRFR